MRRACADAYVRRKGFIEVQPQLHMFRLPIGQACLWRDGDEPDIGDGAAGIHAHGRTDRSIGIHLPRHGVLFTGDRTPRWGR
ncbi:hypothetical protein AB0F96_37675 [Streptomyces sp. NPDC023998]|uniref:hypothetical protein n=1 Tax=Streptomyces sp. NPDC023998 TaxID=3154597 RepID=UPI0033D6B469